jgi:ketosteroid isomerase-like protein
MAVDMQTREYQWYLRHVQFFLDKDIDALLESDYTDDAKLMSYDFAVQGKPALKQVFTQYLQMIGDFTLDATEKFHHTGSEVILEASMTTKNAGVRKVWDVFVLRDGKISHHFTGLKD